MMFLDFWVGDCLQRTNESPVKLRSSLTLIYDMQQLSNKCKHFNFTGRKTNPKSHLKQKLKLPEHPIKLPANNCHLSEKTSKSSQTKTKFIVHTLIFSRSQGNGENPRNNISSSSADLFEDLPPHISIYFNIIYQPRARHTWKTRKSRAKKPKKENTVNCVLSVERHMDLLSGSQPSEQLLLLNSCVFTFFFSSCWHNKSRNKRASRSTSIRLFPAGFHGCRFVPLHTENSSTSDTYSPFVREEWRNFVRYKKLWQNRKIEKNREKQKIECEDYYSFCW